MKDLLKGAYDLHIHCGPDVVPRSVTGLEMARRAAACGMAGFALKAHYGCTCQEAALINELVPECHAVGTLTMNSSTGGISPMAVETAARLLSKDTEYEIIINREQTFLIIVLPL